MIWGWFVLHLSDLADFIELESTGEAINVFNAYYSNYIWLRPVQPGFESSFLRWVWVMAMFYISIYSKDWEHFLKFKTSVHMHYLSSFLQQTFWLLIIFSILSMGNKEIETMCLFFFFFFKIHCWTLDIILRHSRGHWGKRIGVTDWKSPTLVSTRVTML